MTLGMASKGQLWSPVKDTVKDVMVGVNLKLVKAGLKVNFN